MFYELEEDDHEPFLFPTVIPEENLLKEKDFWKILSKGPFMSLGGDLGDKRKRLFDRRDLFCGCFSHVWWSPLITCSTPDTVGYACGVHAVYTAAARDVPRQPPDTAGYSRIQPDTVWCACVNPPTARDVPRQPAATAGCSRIQSDVQVWPGLQILRFL